MRKMFRTLLIVTLILGLYKIHTAEGQTDVTAFGKDQPMPMGNNVELSDDRHYGNKWLYDDPNWKPWQGRKNLRQVPPSIEIHVRPVGQSDPFCEYIRKFMEMAALKDQQGMAIWKLGRVFGRNWNYSYYALRCGLGNGDDDEKRKKEKKRVEEEIRRLLEAKNIIEEEKRRLEQEKKEIEKENFILLQEKIKKKNEMFLIELENEEKKKQSKRLQKKNKAIEEESKRLEQEVEAMLEQNAKLQQEETESQERLQHLRETELGILQGINRLREQLKQGERELNSKEKEQRRLRIELLELKLDIARRKEELAALIESIKDQPSKLTIVADLQVKLEQQLRIFKEKEERLMETEAEQENQKELVQNLRNVIDRGENTHNHHLKLLNQSDAGSLNKLKSILDENRQLLGDLEMLMVKTKVEHRGAGNPPETAIGDVVSSIAEIVKKGERSLVVGATEKY